MLKFYSERLSNGGPSTLFIRAAVGAIFVFLGPACSVETADETIQCPAGKVALDNMCHWVCETSITCSPAEFCDEGICREGERTGLPVITSVNGDGSALSSAERGTRVADGTNPADNHIVSTLWVRGENLGNSSVSLRSATGVKNLEILDTTTGEIHIQLPTDIEGGLYSLRVANSAGIDQVEIQLLTGERGEQGLAGADGIEGAQGEQGVAGADGIEGAQGVAGADGIEGPQGVAGADGIEGPQGVAGADGIEGPQGISGPAGSADTGAQILLKLSGVDGIGSGLDADMLDGMSAGSFLRDAVESVDGTNIAANSIGNLHLANSFYIDASQIDSTGLDSDTLNGFASGEILEQAEEERCFAITHNNLASSNMSPKVFDIPFGCLGPLAGGMGCYGTLHSYPAAPNGLPGPVASVIRVDVEFYQVSGEWTVATHSSDEATVNLVNANNAFMMSPLGAVGANQCSLRTTSGGTRNASTGGFDGLNLRAGAGDTCHLRLCEPLKTIIIP